MKGNELRKYMTEKMVSGSLDQIDPNNIYKPRDSDIVLIGAPKSGTTWLQQIAHQIRTKGDESFRDIYDVTWYIANNGGNYDSNLNDEQVCNPRIYKHHEAYGVIDKTENQKQIIIVRDPYDCAYSYTKFVNRFLGGDDDPDDSEMADMTMQLHLCNKSGSMNCLATWWAYRDDENVLFLFYEDFLKDLKFMIRKISDFVQLPLTDAELERVTRLCSFEYMKENKEKFRGEPFVEGFAKALNLPKWTVEMGMVREGGGKYGQGAEKIGPKLKATVDALWKETMEKQYGYKTYSEFYSKYSCFK